MKKTKYIIAIVLIAAFVLTAVACGKKTPATIETFYQKAAEYGFQKTELSIDDTTLVSVLKDKAFASKESGGKGVVCEFYVAKDAASASSIVLGTKINAESFVDGVRTSSKVESGEYFYYRLSNSNVMCILARIGETVLFIRADKDMENDADDICKALGYK